MAAGAPHPQPAPRPDPRLAALAERRAAGMVTPLRVNHGQLTINMRDTGVAYAVVRSGGARTLISGSSADMRRIEEARRSVKGDFIWYRDGDKTYLIQDPAIVEQAGAAWKPASRMGAKIDQQGKVMDAQGKLMDAIGKRMEVRTRATVDSANAGELKERQQRIEKLAEQQNAIGEKLGLAAQRMAEARSDTERAEASAEMHRLQASMAPIARQIGQQHAALAKLHSAGFQDEMRAMSREMAEASKPMRELSQKMAELAREQEQATRDAEQATRALIQEAVRSGKATQQQPSA
jgi:hypothetical protein